VVEGSWRSCVKLNEHYGSFQGDFDTQAAETTLTVGSIKDYDSWYYEYAYLVYGNEASSADTNFI